MNSLMLLADNYGENENDTDEEEGLASTGGVKRKRKNMDDEGISSEKESDAKLDIPSGVLEMFKESEDLQATEKDHQGRTRRFGHFPGNWATHVFVPFDLPQSFGEFLQSLRTSWPSKVAELHTCDVHDFHVSISRTVPIRHHWIEPLTKLLGHGFQGQSKFLCDFQKLALYVNDEETRSFLALDVGLGISQLNDLVHTVNKAFEEFDLPKYYDEPSFHASFAWCLGNARESVPSTKMKELQRILDDCVEENASLVLKANEIRCVIGNKTFRFDLI